MRKTVSSIIVLLVLTFFVRARAPASAADQYAPYRFLIGKWNVSSAGGGPAVATAEFRWGPNGSYIWYAGSIVVQGAEQPHFEGVLMWNGIRKNLDMLLELDLQQGVVDEAGVVSAAPDGTVVRDITATFSAGTRPIGQPTVGAAGATGRFRQTFRAQADGTIVTTVMRQDGQGWIATFPGSDRLIMTRAG